MLNFKKSKLFTCSLILLTLPCLASAAEVQNDASSFITNQQAQCDNGYFGRRNFIRELSLRDFAGEWVFSQRSVGGVAGLGATGSSVAVDGQATIERNGTGFFNFVSGAIYSGVSGSVTTFTVGPNTTTITITITDAEYGIGTIVINDPVNSFTETLDFIVTRSIDGKVLSFEGHRTSVIVTTTNITTFRFTRQVI